MKDQNHPLYINDREIVNRLIAKSEPSGSDFVDLARLFIRYQDFPGAYDLQEDFMKILRLWNMSREDLNSRVKEIWSKGYRPGDNLDEVVGSGFDTTESENT